MKTINYTSSLPEELLKLLSDYSRKFNVPRNRIMEQALKAYFEKLKKAEYIHSFKNAANDSIMISMTEEGLEDYLKILDGE